MYGNIIILGVQQNWGGHNLCDRLTFSEFNGVSEHVELREWLRVGFRLPVLLDVIDCGAPGVDISWSPVARVEKRMVQLFAASGRGRSERPSCCR